MIIVSSTCIFWIVKTTSRYLIQIWNETRLVRASISRISVIHMSVMEKSESPLAIKAREFLEARKYSSNLEDILACINDVSNLFFIFVKLNTYTYFYLYYKLNINISVQSESNSCYLGWKDSTWSYFSFTSYICGNTKTTYDDEERTRSWYACIMDKSERREIKILFLTCPILWSIWYISTVYYNSSLQQNIWQYFQSVDLKFTVIFCCFMLFSNKNQCSFFSNLLDKHFVINHFMAYRRLINIGLYFLVKRFVWQSMENTDRSHVKWVCLWRSLEHIVYLTRSRRKVSNSCSQKRTVLFSEW